MNDKLGELGDFLDDQMRKLKQTHLSHMNTTEFWLNLPPYAALYIKPFFNIVYESGSEEHYIEYCHKFLLEYSETNNDAKKRCIEKCVFPIYSFLTRRNYDTNYLKTFGV